tara:strand:+ start:145 stop:969 length:825 start_codon:yes stop_codon:yes gene_type:complete
MTAAIDFSDLTGVKPQQPKPQGFQTPPPQQNNAQGFYSPDKVPEDKKPQPASMGYPTQQTPAGDELMQLFPTPVLICPYPIDYTRELEWINNQECRKENSGGDAGGQKIHYNRQSEDTFVLDRPELSNIRAFIEAKLHEFVTKIYASTDKLVITQSWLNKSKKGESHHEHVHPNSMVSGVWYPQIHEQMPPIQFRSRGQRDVSLQTEQYNTFNSATFMLPMKRGELILFPSNLTHSVPTNVGEEERISLSFNTWPKGNMGDIKSLTYLPLDRCM